MSPCLHPLILLVPQGPVCAHQGASSLRRAASTKPPISCLLRQQVYRMTPAQWLLTPHSSGHVKVAPKRNGASTDSVAGIVVNRVSVSVPGRVKSQALGCHCQASWCDPLCVRGTSHVYKRGAQPHRSDLQAITFLPGGSHWPCSSACHCPSSLLGASAFLVVVLRFGPRAPEHRYAVGEGAAITDVLLLYYRRHHHPALRSAPTPKHPSLCG
ncbi:hypothetical protein NDU88_006171 [Pleurodeles waltl]|uniref:Secreted protein n=1 Tax=Pleurodeles waltl TaxID=8319 RepID=A0AAV7ULC6_PLEWA|nr:hypothetical protein NDU88_006171 [Pleurodeles waltl]